MRWTDVERFGLPAKWLGPAAAAMILLIGIALLDTGEPEDRLATFRDLMYDFELGVFGGVANDRDAVSEVEKWALDVRFKLRGNFEKGDRRKLRSYLSEVTKFTGLNFIEVDNGHTQFDLLIQVISDRQMDEIEEQEYERYKGVWATKRSIGCYANSSKSRVHGTIRSAYAVLRRNLVEYCGQHEIMHVLGFNGHFWRSDPSVLYVHEDTENLSLNDKLLMRTLYDERIVPNMDRGAAVAVARQIVTELLAGVKRDGEAALYHPIFRGSTTRRVHSGS